MWARKSSSLSRSLKHSSSVKYLGATRKKMASASIVACDGWLRCQERSWDRYGPTYSRHTYARRTECGENFGVGMWSRPGGYTVSKRRLSWMIRSGLPEAIQRRSSSARDSQDIRTSYGG